MNPNHCESHDTQHVHGPECGHRAVRHGDHVDYVVDDHLHHVDETGTCVDHGPAEA